MTENEQLNAGQQAAETGSLSREDRDTIGEMTNIAMGAAVGTLSALLGQDADISIPEVSEHASLSSLPEPFAGDEKLFVYVRYSKGFAASAGFVMRAKDAKLIAGRMMGNGEHIEPGPLTDLQMAGITEAMSQMMDASATCMASVIHEPVEIDSPTIEPYSTDAMVRLMPKLQGEAFTEIRFDIKLVDGTTIGMAQYLVASEARRQVTQLMAIEPEKPATSSQSSTPPPLQQHQQGAYAMSSLQPTPEPAQAQQKTPEVDPVTVRPVEFASFDNQPSVYGEENKNLSLVMDVNLSLTVELGKTSIPIKDVLELTRGSVIELDRVAGEPVDLLANGKLIAKGEVVVIEDNFGLRITSIVSPADRLRGL